VLGVTFLVAVVGLALFMPKNKSTTSTIVMIGEITKQVDGNEVLQQIMSTDESKLILNNAYIPEAIKSVTQGDDQLFTKLSKSISVAAGDDVSPSGNLVLTSSSITTEYTESMVDIFNNATTKLLALQNKTYKNHQEKIQNRIKDKKLELKIQADLRRIASEKLGLNNERFSNEEQLEKITDKVFLKQEELKHQGIVNAAEKKVNESNRSLTREKAALKRHEELIPILEERVKSLETELSNLTKQRESLYKQVGGDDSSSTLLTEALLAIDNRDSRYRNQIDTLDQQLRVEFTQTRVTIETRLETLSEQIVLEEQAVAIAKQNLEVFRVQRVYKTKELENNSDAIKIKFDSFDASHEAEVLRLEADIVDLELSLEQSTPSEVIAPPTTVPSSKTSLKLVGIGALFVGGMLGCFVAFFLELLAKVKVRAAESA
jgi:chromosome segregation ATPase